MGSRRDARSDARSQPGARLLRHGRVFEGRSHWSRAHRRWLAEQRFDHRAQQIALEEYIHAIEQIEERRGRLTQQMLTLLPDWSLNPVVEAIQTLRGVAGISAITLVAEIGDFHRIGNPHQFMAWLGLVPREHSTGASVKRGSITKAGNIRARRMLVEGAWTYRLPARVTTTLLKRAEDLPEDIRTTAWKAQIRLCARYRRMRAAGRSTKVVTVAISRELAAFVWPHCHDRSQRHQGDGLTSQAGAGKQRRTAVNFKTCCALPSVVAGQGNPRSDSASPKTATRAM
jgi:transposase